MSALMTARTTDGVAWAEPLIFGGGTVALPAGGSEAVTLVGTRMTTPLGGRAATPPAPRWAGGPWNVVAGEADALARPDAMFFEDSQRELLGGLNLGSIREVNGHRVVTEGFTWGLLPFGPSYAFADYDLARELTHTPRDQTNFVLVGLSPGQNPDEVARRLAPLVPDAKILTAAQFRASITRYVLVSTAIGVTLGSSALFGLIVGFVIVALSMFSSVVDNLREFGTLKAIGATTWDLAKLLFVQSVIYASLGSLVGLFAVTRLAAQIRSAQLALVLPPAMFAASAGTMILLCVVASSLALLRLRKLEPAMVFR
jgi:putative ABC transport system permease protein